jgi:transmembrane sensor
METKTAKELIAKYQAGTATAAEVALIEKWVMLGRVKDLDLSDEDLAADFAMIRSQLPLKYVKVKRFSLWPRIAVAAAAVAAIVFGVWFYTIELTASRKAPRNDVAYKNDVAPGKNTATLTLANGKVISLSDAKIGVVVDAGKLAYNDGTVVDPSLRGGTTKQPPFGDEVAASRNAPRNDGMMLTASTPRGGQYQITLPDGTRVWLNADSKISFPAQFIGKERKVLLVNGEAYFEVSTSYTSLPGTSPSLRGRRTKQSFIVESNGQEVEVLGTHFNINAYSDEGSTKTTLLEGSVRVSSLRGGTHETSSGQAKQPHDEIAASRRAPRNDGRNNNYGRNNDKGNNNERSKGGDPGLRRDDGQGDDGGGKSEVLKPGEQAVLTANSNQLKVTQIDPTEAVAWKNGNFVFNDEDLESILRKVSRWYNVDIIYESKPVGVSLLGVVSRSKNVSAVLNALEETGKVHFKIEGRRITVMR